MDERPDSTGDDDGTAAGQATAVLDRPTTAEGDDRPAMPGPPVVPGAGGAGAWGPPGHLPPWAAPPPGHRARRHWIRSGILGLLAAALVAAGAAAGFSVGRTTGAPSTAARLSPSTSGSSLAAAVDQWVVDIDTTQGYQGSSAAGTGIVLSADGEVLTNNHVIAGATRISVTDVGNGRTYAATVVGTDATDDIAVLQLTGASGLTVAKIGSSSALAVGDPVTAVGNAGGVGGTPSVSSGSIVALDQAITASDSATGSAEQLTGMIETDAPLQPGDSGGPLVNAAGQVVGIDTASSSGFGFQAGSSQNFAIPIDTAMSIARQIEAGRASSTVHIGPAAFLGVELVSSDGATGAVVAGVVPGAPAATAGLASGDVIDSLDGRAVTSPADVSSVMAGLHPGQTVSLGWLDAAGQHHSAQVVLASGPPG